MMMVSLLLLTSVCAGATPVLETAMPARISGPWAIEVGPGSVVTAGRTLRLPNAVPVGVPPPERVCIRDEAHAGLPVFNKDAPGWLKGAHLTKLTTEECSATGLLYPETVRVKSAAGNTTPFKLGVDYELDPFWSAIGRVPGGAIADGQPVFVDYDYSPSRLDSVVVDKEGKARLVTGAPDPAVALPPQPGPGETAVVNVWVPGRCERLTEENLYPIEFKEAPSVPVVSATAERLLPKTLAKLREGKTITVVAFGDSVTHGGGVDGHENLWYQHQFAALLKQRFPQAAVQMRTAAWPGAGSKTYLDAPPGGQYDFVRDVLDPRPDLVTIEFVNDAYLDEAGTAAHYAGIMKRLRDIGAEVILITPHLVRPDWLKSDTLKFDEDPRPYVRGLRRFAAENHVALADASREWCRLWRRGIPYVTLLANSINHPDARGHQIFADTLIALFPDR
jgi:lysophospholipase L1-like esterase